MTFEEIVEQIKKIKVWIFIRTEDDWSDRLPPYKVVSRKDPEDDSEGREGYEEDIERIWEFPGPIYIRAKGICSSYGTQHWSEDLEQVYPSQVTTTVYRSNLEEAGPC